MGDALAWSGHAPVVTWAKSRVKTQFKKLDGDTFVGDLQISKHKLPLELLTHGGEKNGKGRRLAPGLRKNGAVVLSLKHTWHATVSKDKGLDTPFTANVFKVVIENFKAGKDSDQFQLRSTYEVKILPGLRK